MKALAIMATAQFGSDVDVFPEAREALRDAVQQAIMDQLVVSFPELEGERCQLTVGTGTPEWADEEVMAFGEKLGKEEVVFRITELLKLAADMGASGADLGSMIGEALRRAIEATEVKPEHNGGAT